MGDDDHERRPDSLLDRFWHPTPRPPAFGKGKIIPETLAGCVCGVWRVWTLLILNYSIHILFDRPWSRLVLSWLSPLIMVGFTRPLEKDGKCLV